MEGGKIGSDFVFTHGKLPTDFVLTSLFSHGKLPTDFVLISLFSHGKLPTDFVLTSLFSHRKLPTFSIKGNNHKTSSENGAALLCLTDGKVLNFVFKLFLLPIFWTTKEITKQSDWILRRKPMKTTHWVLQKYPKAKVDSYFTRMVICTSRVFIAYLFKLVQDWKADEKLNRLCTKLWFDLIQMVTSFGLWQMSCHT